MRQSASKKCFVRASLGSETSHYESAQPMLAETPDSICDGKPRAEFARRHMVLADEKTETPCHGIQQRHCSILGLPARCRKLRRCHSVDRITRSRWGSSGHLEPGARGHGGGSHSGCHQ